MILPIIGVIALFIGGVLLIVPIIDFQLSLINLISIPLLFAAYWILIRAKKKEKSQSKELDKEEVKVKRRDNNNDILCWALGIASFFGAIIAVVSDADRSINRYEILASSLFFLGIILFIIGIVFYIKGERSKKGKQNE